jgi:hypothetical protein
MQHILKEKCPSLHSLNPKQSKWVNDIVGKRNHVCILGSKTVLIWGVLIFFAQKIIFHFLSIRNGFFKAPFKNILQKWTTTISYKNLIPYFMDNSPVVCMEKVLYTPLIK